MFSTEVCLGGFWSAAQLNDPHGEDLSPVGLSDSLWMCVQAGVCARVCVRDCVCVWGREAELPDWDHLPNSIKQDQSDLDLSVQHDYKTHIVTPGPER